MATLQQLDMNILLWIQEHLRVDALTPFWRAVTFLGNGAVSYTHLRAHET